MKVKQSDGTNLELRPGDILWRSCDKLTYARGSNVEHDGSIVALLYLGQNLGGRLAFTVFSIRVGNVVREGHKYDILVSDNKIRVTLGTIKSAIYKMRDLTSPTHICMNNKSRAGRSYIVKQEIFITSPPNMSSMQFVKSGLRITDMRQWPWYSIRWWGKWILGIESQEEFGAMKKYKDNKSLITHLRKMTASNGNKKSVHKRSTWPNNSAVNLHPGLLPNNNLHEPVPDTPIGEARAIRDVIEDVQNSGNSAGSVGQIRWVRFHNPVYCAPYHIELKNQEFPAQVTGDSVVILDGNLNPIYVTTVKAVQHPTKAILRIDDANGESIGLWVISYRDGLLDWITRSSAGGGSSLAVDFNEHPLPEEEEVPMVEEVEEEVVPMDDAAEEVLTISAAEAPHSPTARIVTHGYQNTEKRITLYRTSEDVNLRVEYDMVSGNLRVRTYDNNLTLLSTVIGTGRDNIAIVEYLDSRDWDRIIAEANDSEQPPTIRTIAYMTNVDGIDILLTLKYNRVTGNLRVLRGDNCFMDTTTDPGRNDSFIFDFMDNWDWPSIINDPSRPYAQPADDIRNLSWVVGEDTVLDIKYNWNTGRIRVHTEGINGPIVNTLINPKQYNDQVLAWVAGENWGEILGESSLNQDPAPEPSNPEPQPSSSDQMRVSRQGSDGSKLVAIYNPSSGKVKVTKYLSEWVPGDEVRLLVETTTDTNMSQLDISNMLRNITSTEEHEW